MADIGQDFGVLRDGALAAGRRAGLAAIGVAPAERMVDVERVLEERKAAGLAGTMQFTYRKPRRSTDPNLILPGAAALVVGAWPYATGRPFADSAVDPPVAPSRKPTARVARYARLDHYRRLRQALGSVAEHLQAQGWQARVVADDNALVDRAAAARAGIGWFGKNSNILVPGQGSWFVLGSVVTDAPLPPDEVLDDGCGTCRRCLPSCPTGALVRPGVLDARRCLAWLVQAAGVFPWEHRVALADRLYGCDDCQEVCPVNRRADRQPAHLDEEARPADFIPSAVDVLALLAASDDELLKTFGRWYIPERNPRYLRRNALIILGNVGHGDDPALQAALIHYLTGDDPLLVAHAVWAAARLGRGDLLARVPPNPPAVVAAELALVADVAVRQPT